MPILIAAAIVAWTPSEALQTINLNEITENDFNEIMTGERPDWAIEFSAQTRLPLGFFLKGDLLQLEQSESGQGTLVVQQTFYIRGDEEDAVFSTNLKDWRLLEDFITGKEAISIHHFDGKPSIAIDIEADLSRETPDLDE
jgi:hypothetical protein